jgi:hypothetical protein
LQASRHLNTSRDCFSAVEVYSKSFTYRFFFDFFEHEEIFFYEIRMGL